MNKLHSMKCHNLQKNNLVLLESSGKWHPGEGDGAWDKY